MVDSHRVAVSFDSKILSGINEAILSSLYHKMYPNQWQMSQASHVVIPRWLPDWPGNMQPFKQQTNAHVHLTGLRNKPR